MDVNSGDIIKKELQVHNKTKYGVKCDQYAFINCRYAEQKSICISTSIKGLGWQIGFFDADSQIYFNRIEIGSDACFSTIVRNYWQNGKEGEEKKEGYYSLIKLVKELEINEKHVNDLLDYVEGIYDAGEHWQIYELDRSIELRISGGLEKITVERLSKFFDNIYCYYIVIDLQIINNIVNNCYLYLFRNCKGVVPQKLIINTAAEHICFDNVDNEIHIPEIVMEEKADLRSIIQNKYGDDEHYSILPDVQTLVIRNNFKVLCDLVDYINGRYKIHTLFGNWKLHKLNKNMRIVIEKPGIAFGPVKKITDCFVDVMVDNHKPKEYLARQQPYQKSFQKYFGKHDLKIDQIRNFILAENFILASQELKLTLKDGKFNVGGSNRKINRLYVNQNLTPQQVICFHDTDKPVVIDKIVIEDGGDLRCVLQNAYYNGTDLGFFSLLQTTRELMIHRQQNKNSQVLADLADYIEGKYTLNANWKQKDLDKNMDIKIYDCRYDQFLGIIQRLRSCFKNISIYHIYALLETENVINQDCENYVFSISRDTNPQKLVIDAKLKDDESLIMFNNADGEVCIPEITIGEYGSFDAIVRNYWQNCKNDIKQGYYSLISHVETLAIQNNPEAVRDLDYYVYENYKMQDNRWKIQKLDKNIIIRINGVKSLDEQINRLKEYFGYIVIDGRKALGSQLCEAVANIKLDYDKIQQQNTDNTNKHCTIARTDAEIVETRQRIERARARLGRRRARFQEYLTLAE